MEDINRSVWGTVWINHLAYEQATQEHQNNPRRYFNSYEFIKLLFLVKKINKKKKIPTVNESQQVREWIPFKLENLSLNNGISNPTSFGQDS